MASVFSPACLEEMAFVSFNLKSDKSLLKKVKQMLNQLLNKLLELITKYAPELEGGAKYQVFLDDEIFNHIGDIGKSEPTEKWNYLTRDPTENPDEPTCREKITALHNFVYSDVGGKVMINFVTDKTNDGEYPFLQKRRNQIRQLFKLTGTDEEIIAQIRTIAPRDWRVRISWSPTDYFYPTLAMRRSVIGDLLSAHRKQIIKKIPNSKNGLTNDAKETLIDALISMKKEEPKENVSKSCVFQPWMLNEKFSKVEKDLLISKLRKDSDGALADDVILARYNFKVGACYDSQTIKENPRNKIDVSKGKCRVVGYSGSAALFFDMCLLLNLDWRPMYLGLLIDYVPIHHSIGEVFDALIDFGFITQAEFEDQKGTILKHKMQVLALGDDFTYNYEDFISQANFGYKTTVARGGKRKTRKQGFKSKRARLYKSTRKSRIPKR